MRADDFIADLRGPDEAPLAYPSAQRLSVTDFGPQGPRPTAHTRAVLCCRSGLRAWQAAERLRPHWDGEITLVAFGDTSISHISQETQGELA
jgi:rhodanese-related sulfurtransferase